MKTGTITFHAPNNNGSFLPAYALQQILVKELGVDNEIIDFRSVKQTNQYKTFRPVQCKNDLLKNLASLPHYRKLNIRYARFEEMRNRYLMKTECIVSEEDALKIGTLVCRKLAEKQPPTVSREEIVENLPSMRPPAAGR